MILTECQILDRTDDSEAWAILARFQNVPYVMSEIERRHRPPKSQRDNVRKQAEQIRFCLIQAQEYFEAAKSVTLATKPLLVYYGTMSLALAEVLIKQPGLSSLDVTRTTDAHHGLKIAVGGKPHKAAELEVSAGMLRAQPAFNGEGKRWGTFELWHRSAREHPVAGKLGTEISAGWTESTKRLVMGASDIRMKLVPTRGVSLIDCATSLPSMSRILSRLDVPQHFVRAKIEVFRSASKSLRTTLIVQPSGKKQLADFYEAFKIHPSAANIDLEFEEFSHGFVATWTTGVRPFDDFIATFPPSFQTRCGQVAFSTRDIGLNEFGLHYVAAFILGNYARYYPDFWMKDVEGSSDLALFVASLIQEAESRLPLLTASEMLGRWLVADE